MTSRLLLSPWTVLPCVSFCVGCAKPAPGFRYEVEAVPEVADCGLDRTQDGAERLVYRLVVDGRDVTLFVDEEETSFGTGQLTGCRLDYSSGDVTQNRGEDTIVWRLTGQASLTLGDGCAAGDGWQGTESLTVVSSTSPDIPVGCAVRFGLEGTFLGDGA